MEDVEGTLVVVLSMHRSGSSLTMNVLHELGLSLGPWELLAAATTNPRGHFESVPVLELSREIQSLVHGFIDDLPQTLDDTAAFLERQARWDERADALAAPFLERGRALIEGLARSGPVSGFKDPRTVLLWPFWTRVFAAFPRLRVVPIALVRSPHEIAMSLFARMGGECGYWASLDVVGVHFQRLDEILSEWRGPAPAPTVRFGGPDYFDDLQKAALACGLEWSEETARRVHDGAHVHQRPAVVLHPAQALHDAIARAAGHVSAAPPDNAARLEADARSRDRIQLERIQWAKDYINYLKSEHERGREEIVRGREEIDRGREEIRAAREIIARLEAERDAALARFEAADRAAEETRAAWRELRELVDRIEAHPVLGPVFRGRRELKRLLSRRRAG